VLLFLIPRIDKIWGFSAAFGNKISEGQNTGSYQKLDKAFFIIHIILLPISRRSPLSIKKEFPDLPRFSNPH
jgi:hypothetical protein